MRAAVARGLARPAGTGPGARCGGGVSGLASALCINARAAEQAHQLGPFIPGASLRAQCLNRHDPTAHGVPTFLGEGGGMSPLRMRSCCARHVADAPPRGTSGHPAEPPSHERGCAALVSAAAKGEPNRTSREQHGVRELTSPPTLAEMAQGSGEVVLRGALQLQLRMYRIGALHLRTQSDGAAATGAGEEQGTHGRHHTEPAPTLASPGKSPQRQLREEEDEEEDGAGGGGGDVRSQRTGPSASGAQPAASPSAPGPADSAATLDCRLVDYFVAYAPQPKGELRSSARGRVRRLTACPGAPSNAV